MAQELDFSICEVSTRTLAEGASVACLATLPPALLPLTSSHVTLS